MMESGHKGYGYTIRGYSMHYVLLTHFMKILKFWKLESGPLKTQINFGDLK